MTKPSATAVAISFGGTKLAIAVLRLDNEAILAKTPSIDWRRSLQEHGPLSLDALLDLAATQVHCLLQTAEHSIRDVQYVGLAWPGPGDYRAGLLAATFLPDCGERAPAHDYLRKHLARKFSFDLKSLPIVSSLDVNVRAFGEFIHPSGAFHDSSGQRSRGLVLNVATGIAGALVCDGTVQSEAFGLGQNYGQWGRYLFCDSQSGAWHWIPTNDGSIPPHGKSLVRFTERCAGPAITRRFARLLSQQQTARWPSDLADMASRISPDKSLRNVALERRLLHAINEDAMAKPGGPSSAFIRSIGTEIGQAMMCMVTSTGEPPGAQLVLTGGVGEHFGTPPSEGSDLLLTSIQSEFQPGAIAVARSRVGLDAEFLGVARMAAALRVL